MLDVYKNRPLNWEIRGPRSDATAMTSLLDPVSSRVTGLLVKEIEADAAAQSLSSLCSTVPSREDRETPESPCDTQSIHESWNACHRVLNTAELLAMVLSQLPTGRSLLCNCPRVNKLWKSTIDQSLEIQRILFFKPRASNSLQCVWTDGELNPFLPLFTWQHGDQLPRDKYFYDFGPGPEGATGDETYNKFKQDGGAFSDDQFHWQRLENDEIFMRSDASWRRMLPSQPVLREIWIHHRPEGSLMDRQSSRAVDPKGLGYPRTLGEFYDTALTWGKLPCCQNTKTHIRTSKRFGMAIQFSIEMYKADTKEQVDTMRCFDDIDFATPPVHSLFYS